MKSTEEPNKHPAEQQAETTGTDESVPAASKKKPPGKKFWLIAVVLVVMAAAALIYAYGNNRVENTTTPTISVEDMLQQTNTLIANRKYDEAEAEWNKFLENAKDSEQQVEAHLGIARVYMNKAAIFMNEHDYNTALEHYKKAEQLAETPNPRVVGGIITIASQTSNKSLELEYIPKAIDLLDPDDPLYEADKASYERRLEELNAQSD